MGADALDDMRTRAAARYVSGRLAVARLGAVNRSQAVGLRFLAAAPDYQFCAYTDGNGNGLRTAEILAGIDTPIGPARQLGSDFRGVHFGLAIGIPDVDGVINTPTDAHSQADSFLIRRCALDYQVPYFTTIAGAEAAAEGIEYLKEREFDVKALQDYAAANLT